MKQDVIFEGRTVEEAISNGCEKLGLEREEVEVEVLEVPSKGFLGFGASVAKVKVSFEDVAEEKPAIVKAEEFLLELLKKMGADEPSLDIKERDGKIYIEIKGKELGYLIGRHGETLDAIQYLVSVVSNRGCDEGKFVRIVLDVENYRAKREDTLRNLAKRYAVQAIRTKRSITLEPMTPYERSIIHSAIDGYKDISTHSVGVEPRRCVVIQYQTAFKDKTFPQQGSTYSNQ